MDTSPAPVPQGPPPPPAGVLRRGDRTERLAALVAVVSLLLFAGIAGKAHADAQCRDVVETWTSGQQVVVGSTCDHPADGDGAEVPVPEAPHPDAVTT